MIFSPLSNGEPEPTATPGSPLVSQGGCTATAALFLKFPRPVWHEHPLFSRLSKMSPGGVLIN